MVRSDGEPTYFAADIAYHRDKLERGAERLIDPLGADHHGYVRDAGRDRGARHDPDRFEAPMMQFVRLVEGGERARMSKRKGEFVALDDLIDDIGADAAHFFMLHRSHDTALDLELELALLDERGEAVGEGRRAHPAPGSAPLATGRRALPVSPSPGT